jgi:hypothetical protein
MEVKTIPITGTMQSVSLYDDDTIDMVRQLVSLQVNTHPDRLFMDVKARLPKDYYATNPLHWTDLFLRLSLDGRRISQDRLKVYLTETRMGTGVVERDVTKEEWEDHEEFLKPLYDPDTDFDEWRILGVDEAHSFVLPLPPRDIPLQTASRPIPRLQSLYETLHPYEVTEIRVTPLPSKSSPMVKLNYYPRLRPDTPNTIESLRASIEASRTQFQRLLALDTPAHESMVITRAKWYIPLLSTKFPSPRARFEQIFYGMTVSPKVTPYVGFFTAKTETTRHKFYCEDVKEKKPTLDIPMWKGWTNSTQPQRRLPTLLLYRGTSRASFDRIAVTNRDITIDVRRDKDSVKTLEELKQEIVEWMGTLDALTPFLVSSDIDASRWELGDLSILATYAREIREFDMHRFPCLQTLFGLQNETFRLLRSEHTTDDISPRELQVFQILNQDDGAQTPDYVAQQLGIPVEEASSLIATVRERADELNLEKSLRAYPTVKFANKEITIKFVTNIDRTLKYVNILRHVLTATGDNAALNAVCPRRLEKVIPNVSIPQQEIRMEDEVAGDDDFNALLGFVPEDEEAPSDDAAGEDVPADKKLKIKSRAIGTYNYFNNRLQKFDPATFDKSTYPGKCDKPRQAIIMSDKEKTAAGPQYDFANVPELEKLQINDPDGIVICPPYWCMRDEIPLRENQMEMGSDGQLHCPVCQGKLRTTDNIDTGEFPVIIRDKTAKFPDYLKGVSSINKRKMPCCFKRERSLTGILSPKEEATYVLDSTSANVPALRVAYLSDDLAERLSLKTDYAKSVKKGRIGSADADVFRVGLGRPSKTLPGLLGDTTVVVRPRDAVAKLKTCSFFRTWKHRKGTGTEMERIIASIDHWYDNGELGLLEELEYVTAFLNCEVIRVSMDTYEVTCGFWSESSESTSRTIVLLGTNTVLGHVSRAKEGKAYKSRYTVNIRAPIFRSTLPIVRSSHATACAIPIPTLSDAVAELQLKNIADYEFILDPFDRIQAVFVPGTVLLPVHPTPVNPNRDIPTRPGYANIRPDELPDGSTVRAFLEDTKHAKFKVQSNLYDAQGKIVELELVSGMRIPIQPETSDTPHTANEVLNSTMYATSDDSNTTGEAVLVDGQPNKADLALAQEITYASEIYEFLMFSLSKDIATDGAGAIIDPTYDELRTTIEYRMGDLTNELKEWFKAEAYKDKTRTPVEFVSKVRTPCGQFTDKNACNKSTLCGFHENKCRIRVKPIVNTDAVIMRMVKTLRDNDKQRALVLDGRMSPFFSTVLYLEMPHELITTSV